MSPSAPRSLSRIGLGLCAAYLFVSAASAGYGALAATDSKGQAVFLQLPVALQGALLESIGLGSFLVGLSWPAAYLVLGLPTLAVLYGLGSFLSHRVGEAA
jgi:hypothetical protein